MKSQKILDSSVNTTHVTGYVQQDKPIEGVSCEVKSCKFHAPGGICQAQNISVEAPDASKKIETYCGTYAPNGF